MALIFQDELGLSPLMPGVFVTISDAFGDVVGTGWTLVDGSVSVPIQGATPYQATFRSTQLTPGLTASFFGNALPNADTVVPVSGAAATLFSQQGSAALLCSLLPTGWFDKSELVPGGGAYAINSGVGGGLSTIDASIARLIASIRGQTAQGPDLDAWAFNYFGSWVLRYPGEDDPTFYARCVALMGPRRTLLAIKTVVIAFYAATLQERIIASAPNLSFDTQGGFDTSGGLDTYITPLSPAALTPVVDVWDHDSNPTLAAEYSIDTPQFVIQIGFSGAARAWYLDRSFLDIDTFLIDQNTVTQTETAPDPRLAYLVDVIVKASGTRPIYQIYSSS